MRIGRALRFVAAGVAVGLVLVSALAATNTVTASKAGRSSSTTSVDDKKPKPDCNGIAVTNLVTGGGDGGNAADLLLGTAAANTISGKNGNDCIVGGAGNDNLTGAGGTDVCIGGPGTDTFTTCETQIQ
jgi:Ca2+-binding RTX toxin-like protein